ncbi:NSL1 (YPL233W) [Zygosaccharomyces parabailii]|nr:NSL1 (YPL233W) [Zygosaccharomyces parabailii]CDH12851.1 related to Kinetochore-associated protein NSL1 [Zygosaccharomyces bailii ISA1307]
MSKIDVTVGQLRAIYGQLYDVLQEKAALHLPEGQDPVSKEVRMQLQLYLAGVMEMGVNSLRVDGGDAKDVLATRCEPFDLELNERVRGAYEEWEDETVRVANLRRAAQEQIVKLYNESKNSYLDSLDEIIDGQGQQQTAGEENQPSPDRTELTSPTQDYHSSLNSLAEAQAHLPRLRSQLEKLSQLLHHIQDA